MRAKRYGRCGTWLVLGFVLLLTASTPTPRPAFLTPAATDTSVPAIGRSWPVGARPTVLRGWEPPATAYGRGHRGVDLAAPPGSPVRAVAPGRVSFAGRVAGKGVVSVELTGTDLRTTYEPVTASVEKGAEVAAGEVVGTVAPTGSHCTTACVHWGLRRGEAYLDPLSLLPPWLLRRGPSRLLPVLDVPLP
ncbi:murein hydrolase activator EnvC family protein [Streptomyces sp. NPDC086033]|uniref:murein hydrolase activator EnvC family protein n=1 Tax=Streptomyces sp. NPDC086033 TaxID=3365747 RepID=UPI0037CD5F86